MNFRGQRILIVDDDDLLREVLLDLFTDYGAQVTGAENGQVAFSLIEKNNFDVVISDARMPGGDGIDLARNIKQNIINNPPLFFICSGYNDIKAEQIRELNIKKIFDKPFNSKQIVEDVLFYLENSK